MVENKPTPRKPRGTAAARSARKPPAATPEEPAIDAEASSPETPDTESPYVTPDVATPDTDEPGDTGPLDAVTEVIDVDEPAESEDLAETLQIELAPATSPALEDRSVLLARLQLLETENARLAAHAPVSAVAPARRRRKPGRTTAAIICILLGALLAPVAVVGSWARGLVVDGDRYVDTVAPIADDPLVQSAIENRVTTAIVTALDLESVTTQATDALANLNLPPVVSTGIQSLQGPLLDAITGFVHKQVVKIISSDAFTTTWTEANRTAHEQIVATLRGDPDAIAQISSTGELTLDLTPIIEQVKASLVDAGFTLAGRIPTVTVTLPIASSADLVRLQNAYRAIDFLGQLLPWLSLGLLAVGVIAAQRRSRALVVAGLSLAGAMALLALALAIGRSFYASSLPPTVQRPDVAVAIYDQFVSLLRIELRVGLVLGLLVAIIAFVAGGTPAATSLRASSSQASAWLRGAGDRHGVSTGPVGIWLFEQRTLVRVVVIALAVLALVLADRLTPAYVITVAVIALVVIGVATLAGRPDGAVAEANPRSVSS